MVLGTFGSRNPVLAGKVAPRLVIDVCLGPRVVLGGGRVKAERRKGKEDEAESTLYTKSPRESSPPSLTPE